MNRIQRGTLAQVIGLALLLATVGCSLAGEITVRTHTLEFPLMLTGSLEGKNHLLPAGTTLYLDQSFPEGFTRYKIYVNVEGVTLPSKIEADPTLITPISAFPIGKTELRQLFRQYPLSKEELASILKSGVLSKEEIRELLSEFSK